MGGQAGPLLELIVDQAHRAMSQRLGLSGAADIFFEHFGRDGQGAHRAIAAAINESIPELAARRTADGVILALAVPEGKSGDRLVSLVEQAADGRPVVRASSIDDLVIYCERGNVPLTDLPPLSPAGRDGYEKALASDGSPHARTDIKWTLPASPAKPVAGGPV
jgi:hypothetical protein